MLVIGAVTKRNIQIVLRKHKYNQTTTEHAIEDILYWIEKGIETADIQNIPLESNLCKKCRNEL